MRLQLATIFGIGRSLSVNKQVQIFRQDKFCSNFQQENLAIGHGWEKKLGKNEGNFIDVDEMLTTWNEM